MKVYVRAAFAVEVNFSWVRVVYCKLARNFDVGTAHRFRWQLPSEMRAYDVRKDDSDAKAPIE